MPGLWMESDNRPWREKIMRGSFSDTKKHALEHRYAQRRIRLVWA